MSLHANSSTPKRKKRSSPISAVVTPDRHVTNQATHQSVVLRLVPQRKPAIKCRDLSMTSPSSIFAAVNSYQSIRDALQSCHGNNYSNTSNDSLANHCLRFRETIFRHFGECQKFRIDFDYHTAKSSSPHFSSHKKSKPLSLSAMERSFHKAVRHICDKACFLRAYAPIREFCFLWRDLCIDIEQGASAPVTSDGCIRRLRLETCAEVETDECLLLPTKSQVLNGWKCHLKLPLPSPTSVTETPKNAVPGTDNLIVKEEKRLKRKQGQSSSMRYMTFVSPNGEEFEKKVEMLKHLNVLLKNSPELHTVEEITLASIPTPLSQCVTSINALFSPLGLLEELFTNDPWKLLLSTIFLNKTQRSQVDVILFHFLQRWPDAQSAAIADADEVRSIIAPLGLMNKRSKSVVRFSNEYLQLIDSKRSGTPPLRDDKKQLMPSEDNETAKKEVEFGLSEKDVLSLHQCGTYAWTAYQIFILKELPQGDTFKVCDHALQLYAEYKLGWCLQGCW